MSLLPQPTILWVVFMVSTVYATTFFTDNDLGQSVPIGRLKKRQKQQVQQEILELMGLYSKPQKKTNEKIVQSASKFMRELYDNLTEDEKSGSSNRHIRVNSHVNASGLGLDPEKVETSNVIVSFVNRAEKIPSLRHRRNNTFFFDFSEVSVGEQLKFAELRLFKEPLMDSTSGPFTITLYCIKQGQDWEDRKLELESSLVVDWDTSGWLMLDATKAAEEWTFFPHSNLGLYLKVHGPDGKEHHPGDIGIIGKKGQADKQSFLVGYMEMTKELLERRTRSIRRKRWAEPEEQERSYADSPHDALVQDRFRGTRTCQRHNLYIDFRKIGFDSKFLIAPEGYSAFYCSGECSFPLFSHMNATNHAIVQTLVSLMNNHSVPKPCCAPTKFGSIALLYIDDNTSVVLKHFGEMVVDACGCQ